MPGPHAEAAHEIEGGLARHDRESRLRLAITGPDRVKFLHNLTTQNVKALQPGQGGEAFVTSPQGKTLAFVSLHVEPEEILLRADHPALEWIEPHFRKYAVFDDVAWHDLTAETVEWHIAGPGVERILEPPPGATSNSIACRRLAGHEVRVIAESPLGQPGLTVIGPVSAAAELSRAFDAIPGCRQVGAAGFELSRIRAGYPATGREVTPECLPQELDRDATAISFDKGCYLGQETVARLDALGHVNRILRRLEFEADLPPVAGVTTLVAAGNKPAGRITSAAYDPAAGRWIGLGFVRVANAQSGCELQYEIEGRSGDARVGPVGGT